MKTSKLSKLDRPPAAPNWVRFNSQSVHKMARAITNFAFAMPPFTFQPGLKCAQDRIELGLDLETAIKAVRNSGSPAGREHNEDFVRAFFAYDKVRNYSGCKSFDGFQESFSVSREIRIPCKPTSVILEHGRLVPIFVCGWSSVPLDMFQRRLLMTIYEDAIFSLTDFQESPAEVLFFPKDEQDSERGRVPEVWRRGDYDLLSNAELSEQIDMFMRAREQARVLIAKREEDTRNKSGEDQIGERPGPDPAQGSLF